MNGDLKVGDYVRISEIDDDLHRVVEVGTFNPNIEKLPCLKEGTVGYVNC